MSITHSKDKKFLIKTSTKSVIPSFCPVCEFVIKTAEDSISIREFSCCHQCAIQWAESRREIWKRGWRPNKSDLEEFKKERRYIRSKFSII